MNKNRNSHLVFGIPQQDLLTVTSPPFGGGQHENSRLGAISARFPGPIDVRGFGVIGKVALDGLEVVCDFITAVPAIAVQILGVPIVGFFDRYIVLFYQVIDNNTSEMLMQFPTAIE